VFILYFAATCFGPCWPSSCGIHSYFRKLLHPQQNKYPPHTYLNTRTKQSKNMTPNTIQKQKWVTFTYIGKETRTITRLFKNTNIRIAYKTKNTIQNHLQPRKHDTNKYNNSGIYQVKCNSCQLRYIGQTDRNIKSTYRQYVQTARILNMHNTYWIHNTHTALCRIQWTFYILKGRAH
jgi:hypothetical protein